jgi:hypothetical protein
VLISPLHALSDKVTGSYKSRLEHKMLLSKSFEFSVILFPWIRRDAVAIVVQGPTIAVMLPLFHGRFRRSGVHNLTEIRPPDE